MLTVEVCTRKLSAGGGEAAFSEHRRALMWRIRRAVATRELPLEARRVLEQLRGNDEVGLGRLLQRPGTGWLGSSQTEHAAHSKVETVIDRWRAHGA